MVIIPFRIGVRFISVSDSVVLLCGSKLEPPKKLFHQIEEFGILYESINDIWDNDQGYIRDSG